MFFTVTFPAKRGGESMSSLILVIREIIQRVVGSDSINNPVPDLINEPQVDLIEYKWR
jgi:hypothetical protein